MIERTNPFKSIDSKSIKKAKEVAKKSITGGLLTAILFTMSGCGKDATEVLVPFNEGDNIPENSIVFEIDDNLFYIDGQCLIEFKDKSIRDFFKDEPISYYDVILKNYLTLNSPSSLDELSLFQNLEKLYISDCDLEDLSIIQQLHNLKTLSLDDCNNITDLSFLADMDLESLTLTDMSRLNDLSFVGEMEALKDLTIDNCGGSTIDTEAISKLNLESLDISFMAIDNLDCLENMNNLESLYISNTNLKEISGIRELHNLKELTLSDCLISDVSSLYGLANLEELDLRNNSIDSLDLSKFPNLQKLYIGYNFALYTDSFFNYCLTNGIETDITKEDVDCMNQIREIVTNLDLDGLTDAQKEAKIYAYVLDHMQYDKKGSNDDFLVSEYNKRALYYALQGKGVCATYAAMFDAMCDVAGIESFHVSGYAKGGLFNLSGGPHAWNLVEVDGQYMLCDPTWSDTVRDSLDYKVLHVLEEEKTDKYFNVSGEDVHKFANEHMEEAYNRNDDVVTPRTDEATGEILSIQTTDENGEKISGAVLTGIVTGSVVLVGGAAVGIAVHNSREKKRRAARRRREAEARRKEASNGYSSKYRY